MPEINICFHAYFNNEEKLGFFCQGFSDISSGLLCNAKKHFLSKNIDLSINDNNPGWHLEKFDSRGGLCVGNILAHAYFMANPLYFIKGLSDLGADYVLGTITNENGDKVSIGFKNGEEGDVEDVESILNEITGELMPKGNSYAINYSEYVNGMDIDGLCEESSDDDWLECLKAYKNNGGDVTAYPQEWSGNLLHVAAYTDNIDAIKWLVENGLDINSRDNIGNTPLHIAVESACEDAMSMGDYPDSKIIALMLELGSDVSLKNEDDEAPYDIKNGYDYIKINKIMDGIFLRP
jgi:ankyrin repeat protein